MMMTAIPQVPNLSVSAKTPTPNAKAPQNEDGLLLPSTGMSPVDTVSFETTLMGQEESPSEELLTSDGSNVSLPMEFPQNPQTPLSPAGLQKKPENQPQPIAQVLQNAKNAQRLQQGPTAQLGAAIPLNLQASVQASLQASQPAFPAGSKPVTSQKGQGEKSSFIEEGALKEGVLLNQLDPQGLGLTEEVQWSSVNPEPVTEATAKAKNHFVSGSEFMQMREKALSQPNQSQIGTKAEKTDAGLAAPLAGLKGNSKKSADGLREVSHRESDVAPNLTLQPSIHAGVDLPRQQTVTLPRVETSGHVVLGSMARERLSSESVLNVGQGLQQIARAGGGEMQIRLKPDNLGELTLRVSSMGNRVGVKVVASDERTQRIMEESVQQLREQLSSQNLTLTKFDIVTATSNGQGFLSTDSGSQFQPQNQNQSSSQQNQWSQLNDGRSQQQGSSRENPRDESAFSRHSRGWVGDLESKSYRGSQGQSKLNVVA